MRSVQPGDIVAGKYVVERIIGKGGVGIVASARHVALRQLVALKFLRPELETDTEVLQRFLREAEAAAQIRSEHVCRVMDTGALDDGTAFLVFEYLAGRDLAAVLRDDGPLPITLAVDYVMQACEAIGEAHALGIVHRDLKPANLFLTRGVDGAPLIKVLDFGLSKFQRSSGASALTADNHIIGSPHFMSPEQMRSSREADARSDIWALGVILFALISGRVPFEGQFLTEVCAAVLTGKPPALTLLRPETPPGLEAVVLRCLESDPNLRFASVAELAEGLHLFGLDMARGRVDRLERVVTRAQLALLPAFSPPRAELGLKTLRDDDDAETAPTLVAATAVSLSARAVGRESEPDGARVARAKTSSESPTSRDVGDVGNLADAQALAEEAALDRSSAPSETFSHRHSALKGGAAGFLVAAGLLVAASRGVVSRTAASASDAPPPAVVATALSNESQAAPSNGSNNATAEGNPAASVLSPMPSTTPRNIAPHESAESAGATPPGKLIASDASAPPSAAKPAIKGPSKQGTSPKSRSSIPAPEESIIMQLPH